MCDMIECTECGLFDIDIGCMCPSSDLWYACPIESVKPENIKALKEYAEWSVNMKVRNQDLDQQ